jgi:hypothetical protein
MDSIGSELDYSHYLFKQLDRIQKLEELLKNTKTIEN